MSDAARSVIANVPLDSSADPSPDFDALIASLRTAGADRFDPARLHYIDVLAKRAGSYQGSIRRMLDIRLAQALAAFQTRFDQARCDSRDTIARTVSRYPHAAESLERFFAVGDFKGLQRHIAALEASEQRPSLTALVRQLEQHAPEDNKAHPEKNAGSRPELRTIRNFRNTWSKLSVDKQVAKALEQAPKNAGPINSHMLALRSLALMRDISPDYLNRFISYADTLLCLDQCEKDEPGAPKKRPGAKAARK